MMLFEGTILGVLSLAVAASVLPRQRFAKFACMLALVTLSLTGLYALLLGARWLTMPAVIVAIVVLGVSISRRGDPKGKNWLRKLGHGLYCCLVLLGLALSLIASLGWPWFTAPKPDGPYSVGKIRAHITDQDRPELATPDNPDDRRELMVQAWYPARVQGGDERSPLFPDPRQPQWLLADTFGLPQAAFGYLHHIPGNSVAGAPVETEGGEAGRYPILVFNHGFGSFSGQNSLLMEQLASHGYIVFSIDHPYQAGWVGFPDGRDAAFLPTGFESVLLSEDDLPRMLSALDQASNAASYEAYYKRIMDFIAAAPDLNRGLDIWLADITTFLDHLETGQIAEFDSILPALDMKRLGVFGMSYGGAAAGMFCAADSRCKAGMNMDGLQYGVGAGAMRLEKPFMIMNADRRLDFGKAADAGPLPFEINDFVFHQAAGPAHSVTVAGSRHLNYGDIAYLAPIMKLLGGLGPIPADRMNEIMNSYTLAFFDQYLKAGGGLAALKAQGNYPEILEFVSKGEAENKASLQP